MALGNDLLELHGVFLSGRGRIRSENMRPAPGIPGAGAPEIGEHAAAPDIPGAGAFVSASAALVPRFFPTEAAGADGALQRERRFLPSFAPLLSEGWEKPPFT